MRKIFYIGFIVFLLIGVNLSADDYVKESILNENRYLTGHGVKMIHEWENRKKRYENEITDLEKRIENIEKDLTDFKKKSLLNNGKNNSLSNMDLREKKILKKVDIFLVEDEKVNDFLVGISKFFKTSSSLKEFSYRGNRVVLAGFMGGVYKNDREQGFIKFDENGPDFIKNSFYKKEIDSAFDGENRLFPIIFTKDIKMDTNFFTGLTQYLEKGGVMIWPIILTGFLGLILSIIQALLLFVKKVPSKEVGDNFFKVLKSGDIPKDDFKNYPSLLSIVEIVSKTDGRMPSAEVAESLFDKNLAKLEKYIPTIGVLAAIAPLLGLLGTVTGMILTFNAVGTQGLARASEMAIGISEALVTTQLGLSIALPLMVVHHFYEQRVEMFGYEMDEKKNIYLNLIRQDEPSK